MSNDIVLRDYDVLNPLINISDRVELAENVATTLKTILTQQKLIQKIKGNEYGCQKCLLALIRMVCRKVLTSSMECWRRCWLLLLMW